MAEAIDELLVAFDFFLLIAIGLHLLIVALLALLQVGAVVSCVGDELRGIGIDLDDGFDERVHEVTIVGNHQDGTGVVEQVALEPEKGDEIEVVGGLVEHQQIGLHDEEAGKVGAHDPATRVFMSGLMEIFFFKAEAAEDFFCLGFELVAVEMVELVLSFGVFGVAVVVLGLMLAHGSKKADHFGGDTHGNLDDGLIARFAGLLGKVAGDGVFVAFDGTFVGRILIEDHAKQGGLTGAIRADKGDAFAPVDGHFGFA